MRQYENRFLKPTEQLRNLQVLEEVAQDSSVSQRKLSHFLGVALGVTNVCMRKMIRKGYIKAKGVNHKRIAYYLTPQGLSEKSRLTYRFLQHTISYYVGLKKNITSKLNTISISSVKNLLFYGAGEVMEVAFICLNNTEFQLIGIADDSPDKQGKKLLGFNIIKPDLIKSLNPDAILITSIRYKDKIFDKLKNNKELEGIGVYLL
ncbi:MAG TPA: hypothetical protein DCY56_04545 [Candidatus Omnitrophica bacterium]|nr:hypothetical protein [Candidatus Omnitrophota bacterium]